MASSIFSDGIWGIVIVIGPILLAAAIIWAMVNNRQTRRGAARTEAATRDLYREQDAADKREGPQ